MDAQPRRNHAARFGLVRLAACTPRIEIADVDFNVRAMIAGLDLASSQGADLAVFPELGITGYSCADLFQQTTLLESALSGLLRIARHTRHLSTAAVVGLPLRIDGKLFNCAALCAGGRIAGLVPKINIPNSGEYYEARWFCSGTTAHRPSVRIENEEIPFGIDLLFATQGLRGFVLGIEICEDLWSPLPPSANLALAGATIIANASASNAVTGKAHIRRMLVQDASRRYECGYVYAGAGPHESTTDTVFAGQSLICEGGTRLAESNRTLSFADELVVADADIERIHAARSRNCGFRTASPVRFRTCGFDVGPADHPAGARTRIIRSDLTPTPFVPVAEPERSAACLEAFSIQKAALIKRLLHSQDHAHATIVGTKSNSVTIALSGGLDSTLALLVTAAAFDELGVGRSRIVGITMPGPGTTSRTLANAVRLAESLDIRLLKIPIESAVARHLAAIGHDAKTPDATYQNAHARERTRIAMDVASLEGGFQVGSSDLSELALGYCTFNGDHMAMYQINCGVPKTLVRAMVEWAGSAGFSASSDVLRDICATPSTPELAPTVLGAATQVTEQIIGPDALHDFFIYYTLKFGFGPTKLFVLASSAFGERYGPHILRKWLTVFYIRFFASQFKRSALPDGPKVCEVALSPRSDLRMPSDASPVAWLRELRELSSEAVRAA